MGDFNSCPASSVRSHADEEPQQQQRTPLGAPINKSAETHEIESRPPEDAWVVGFKEKLQVASQDHADVQRKDAVVYRVPDYLKDPSRSKDYTPRFVSLGPYHRGSAPLKKLERHKWLLLRHVLERTGQDVKLFLECMKELEPKARACYAEESELTSNQFAVMMLLDGCIMFEILQSDGLRRHHCANESPFFSMPEVSYNIQLDMVMLETQIPLFVLDKLLRLQSKNHGGERSVLETANKFFDQLMPLMAKATKGIHCLDVVREKIVKDLQVDLNDKNHERLNYCATELRNAGIKFRKGDHGKSILDIEFKKGILYIPQITIDDGFKSLISNLIAYEQCHLDSRQQNITSYVAFLDDLIDSPEDVRYIHKIIKNWLGSDAEIAHIISNLGHGAVFSIHYSYLSCLSYRLNKYHNQTQNIWWATLKERHFNNPWAIISLVAAAILLILTATQTLYGAYSYYRQNN